MITTTCCKECPLNKTDFTARFTGPVLEYFTNGYSAALFLLRSKNLSQDWSSLKKSTIVPQKTLIVWLVRIIN